jgi:hypothetical protein
MQVIGQAVLSMSPEESDRVFPQLYLPIVEEANARTWYPWRALFPTESWRAYYRCINELNAFVTDVIRRRAHAFDEVRPPTKEGATGQAAPAPACVVCPCVVCIISVDMREIGRAHGATLLRRVNFL